MRIMTDNQYHDEVLSRYQSGVEYGYKQALTQFRLELERDISKTLDKVHDKIRDCFNTNVTVENTEVKQFNLDVTSKINSVKFNIITVQLPIVAFRVTLEPKGSHFSFMVEADKE